MGAPIRARLAVKKNPWDVLKNMKQQTEAKKRPANYIIENTLKTVPLPPLSLRSAVPREVGAFIPDKIEYKHSKKAFLYLKPFKIEYPEDEIRKEFYKVHPYELFRPVCLVESPETLAEREWTDIDGGDVKGQINSRKVPLSGESVVKRAMHLISKEKLSKSVAYRQAVQEFYARAAEIEQEAQLRKEQLIKQHNDSLAEKEQKMTETPFADAFLKLEQDQLRDSALFERELQEKRQMLVQTEERIISSAAKSLK